MRVRTWCVGLAAAILVGACGGGSTPGASESGSPTGPARCEPRGIISVGESIPFNCSFERLEGGVLELAELRGRPAMINFWASWCTFCIEEMPGFQRVFEAFGGRVQFVGMNLLDVQGETRAAAERFAKSTGVRYLLAYDRDGLLYAHFSARLVMPVTVLTDGRGVVVHRQFGPFTEKQLRDLLKDKLGLA